MSHSILTRSSLVLIVTIAMSIALMHAASFGQLPISSGTWNGQTVEFAQGRAILSVTSDTGFTALSGLRTLYGITVEKERPSLKMYIIKFSESLSVIDVCSAFNADHNTRECCPDFVISPLTEDAHFERQWGLRNVDGDYGSTPGADMMVEEAFAVTRGSSAIKIGILDSGIPYDDLNALYTHRDLGEDSPTRFELGCMCYPETPQDPHQRFDWLGHGTHIAGIALAEENDYGTVGVCPECTGVIEKIMHRSATGIESAIMNAIWDAETRGVHVMNLSYRVPQNENLTAVFDEAGNTFGVLFTIACGNDGAPQCSYPALLSETREFIMAVGGTNPDDHRWRYASEQFCPGSNYGTSVNVVAPAGGIWCPDPYRPCTDILSSYHLDNSHWICDMNTTDRVVYGAGTSDAAPAVAGIAGLLLSYDPSLTNTELRNIIEQSADHNYGNALPVPNDTSGYGRVNAFKALLRAPGTKTLSSSMTLRRHIYDAYSPYYVVDQLVVSSGVTLTIEPGARIVFAPGASLRTNAGGRIIANGTQTDHIVFEGDVTGFLGVYLYGGTLGAQNQFTCCDFLNASLPVRAMGNSYSALTSCTFDECSVGMLVGSSATVSAWDCHVAATGQYGILNVGNLEMRGGSIIGASRAGIWCANLSSAEFRSWTDPSNTEQPVVITNNGDGDDDNLYYGGIRNTFSQLRLWCVESTGNYGPGLTCLGGDTYMGWSHAGKNCFQDNLPRGEQPQTQIYFSGYSAFEMCNGRNRIYDETGALIIDGLTDRIADISGNNFGGRQNDPGALPAGYWWNGLDPSEICLDRCGLPNYGRCLDSESLERFEQATDLEFQMFYDDAIVLYESIIRDFPGSKEAKLCPDRIVVCKKYLPGSWADRQAYFLSVADTTSDRDLNYECRSSAAWCMVEMDNFEAAQDTFIALLDEFNENYKYEKTSLIALLAEIKEAPWEGIGIQSVGHYAQDRTLEIVEQMESVLNTSGSSRVQSNLPRTYALHQNYPNPFNPTTTIRFDLPEATRVQIKIFNTLGQEVATLLDGLRPAGVHNVEWNAVNVSSGLYIYQIKAGSFVDSKKMLLLK